MTFLAKKYEQYRSFLLVVYVGIVRHLFCRRRIVTANLLIVCMRLWDFSAHDTSPIDSADRGADDRHPSMLDS